MTPQDNASTTNRENSPYDLDRLAATIASLPGVACVGCGTIAHEMATALGLANHQFVGAWSRTLAKTQAFCAQYGIARAYADLDELLADPAVGVVYVATPHNTHHDYIRRALLAGKHVFCEKSITLNAAELDDVRALAAERGLQLVEGMTIYHMPLMVELRRRLDAGEFGRVNAVTLNFGSFKPYAPENRFFNPRLAGGALLDIGVYALSMARLFLDGTPTTVASTVTLAPTGVDEASGIVMRTESGQVATATLTLRSKQPKRAMVSCDKCYIEVMEYPRAHVAQITWTETGQQEVVDLGTTEHALTYEMADLARAIEASDADAAAALTRIGLTTDVSHIMTGLRQEWGAHYPGEQW